MSRNERDQASAGTDDGRTRCSLKSFRLPSTWMMPKRAGKTELLQGTAGHLYVCSRMHND
jgi:hypothetical protein